MENNTNKTKTEENEKTNIIKNNPRLFIIIAVAIVVLAIVIGVIVAVVNKKNAGTVERVATQTMGGLDVLCEPSSIALIADQGFLVTDVYGKQIWLINSISGSIYAGKGSVEDMYGQPLGGYNDSELKDSLFKEPWAISPFLNGYAVSDTQNGAIRLISSTTTQTVNGYSEELEIGDLGVKFDKPTGLATDEAGNLYISETGKGAIRRVTPDGEVTTVAEGLDGPMGLYAAGDYIYVAETASHRIVRVKDGQIEVVAGTGEETPEGGLGDGSIKKATFRYPQGVAVADDGTVFVADTVSSTVRMIRNNKVTTILQREGEELDIEMYPVSPRGLFIDNGSLYVCDPFARRVYVLKLEDVY